MFWKLGQPDGSTDLNAQAQSRLGLLLATIASVLILLDAAWIYAGGFRVDVRSYAIIAALLSPLAFGAVAYSTVRPDRRISATCTSFAFLLAFSPSCAVLSYLLSTVAGPRIDDLLASIDLQMGFHWVALMTLAAQHTTATALLRLCYVSVMPQIMLLVFWLGWSGRSSHLYGLCMAIAIGAIACVFVWALFPSFGAFSVFELPPTVATKLGLALDGNYGRDLIALLRNGPGFITPLELRGIVGFPSFHTVQALVIMWYARKLPAARWIAIALNLAVLIATPIQGGHHLVDLLGGAGVAAGAIYFADGAVRRARRLSIESRVREHAPVAQQAAVLQ
jgi:hypothetical protein